MELKPKGYKTFVARMNTDTIERLRHLAVRSGSSKSAIVKRLLSTASDDQIVALMAASQQGPKKTRHDSSLAATIMAGPTN